MMSGASPIDKAFLFAAQPRNCEWLFNFTRYLCSLPFADYELMPFGTASNEALHRELNATINPKQVRYEPTLVLTLRGAQFGKVLSHDAAVDRPTTRQVSQDEVQIRTIGAMKVWTERRWFALCSRVRQAKEDVSLGNSDGKASNAKLQLQSHAMDTIAKVKESKALARLRKPPTWWNRFGVPEKRCTTKTRLQTPFGRIKTRRSVFAKKAGSLLYSCKPDRYVHREFQGVKKARKPAVPIRTEIDESLPL